MPGPNYVILRKAVKTTKSAEMDLFSCLLFVLHELITFAFLIHKVHIICIPLSIWLATFLIYSVPWRKRPTTEKASFSVVELII